MWEINQHLAGLRGAAPTMADMPDAEAPEVCVRLTATSPCFLHAGTCVDCRCKIG